MTRGNKLPSRKVQQKASIKYDEKTYEKHVIRLRKDIDQELIDFIAEQKEKGVGITELVRQGLVEMYREEND